MTSVAYRFVIELLNQRASADREILEIGCGERLYEPELVGRYTGLDLDEWMGVERRPDIVGTAEAIPVEDESFDVVFGVAVFYYVADPDRALRECRRVLRPGGELVIFDYEARTIERLRAEGDRLVRNAWTRHELRDRLRRAGFAAGGIRDLSHLASSSGVPRGVRRPVRRVRRALDPRWTHWLILRARR